MSPLLVGLLAVTAYAGALAGLRLMRTSPASVRALDVPGRTTGQQSIVGSLRATVGRRVGPRILRQMSPAARRRIERRLDLAGRPDRLGISGVAEARAADTATCLLLGLGAATVHPILLPLVTLYGWFRVDLRLRAVGRTRQARIERDLPDFLDVLGVTIGAGLKFRAALRRVGDQFEGPVAEEFRVALQQMEVGASRRAAFEGIRDRTDSPSLNRFVGALLQAEELGAPLTDAMVTIARDMRKSFAQRVRKQAAEAAPKVSLVATVLLMPGAALLLIGGMLIGGDIDLGGIFGG